jgi:hypothetical protein
MALFWQTLQFTVDLNCAYLSRWGNSLICADRLFITFTLQTLQVSDRSEGEFRTAGKGRIKVSNQAGQAAAATEIISLSGIPLIV